jgi:ATP-dependent helicase/nuclease subunit B
MKFLQQLAAHIKSKNYDLRSLTVILPSERATKYLAEALLVEYGKPIFAPEITTIDRWVKKHSQPIIDNTRLLIRLFEMYRETEEGRFETFEEFTTWGSMLLSDFDDIDRYMLDYSQVFKNLKAIKELESWKIDEEKFSASQKKFMEFWERIPTYYDNLHRKIIEKGFVTAGLAYRQLAENPEPLFEKNENQLFIFAGFNALSLAELTIIKKLIRRNRAEYIINADKYYLDNPIHEAGAFLRKNLDFLEIKDPLFISDELDQKELDIQVVECAQHTGQVKVAATELEKLSKDQINETLVLLSDESLIGAMVKNIPASVGKANVTLGLPLSQTPIKSWVELIFDIQENKIRFKTDAFYFKDLQRSINNVLILSALDEKEKNQLVKLEQETIRKNKIFQRVDNLQIGPKSDILLQALSTNWKNDWKLAMTQIRKLNSILLESLNQNAEFERNIVLIFDDALLEFQRIIEEGIPEMNLRSFKSLFYQHWNRKNMAFHGNPTKGLQIMGLLETRLMDFERIFILGFNEGKLPGTNPVRTIIPMDLRYGLGLPSTRDKQGIFAHHFYRLLHHCKNLWITYTTAAEQIGSNEASRYLLQLKLELAKTNENVKISNQFYTVPFPELTELPSNVVNKKPEIIERLDSFFERSISASALNKYLTCPLDFYYRYLVEFGEEKSVEEGVESNTFGSFIHKTLELLFKPFAQRDEDGNHISPPPPPIKSTDIDKMLEDYKPILHNQFLEFFGGDESLFKNGKNLLSYEMAMEITKNVLLKEKEFLSNTSEIVYIEQVEAAMSTELDVTVNGKTKRIKFKGYIDRIDRIGNTFRVIDYKSGKVKDDDVKFNLLKEGLKQSFLKTKHALQLTLYCLFFKEKYNCLPDQAIIMSLIKSDKLHDLKFENGIEGMTLIFQELVQELLNEIYNLEINFEHNLDANYCGYCA